MKIAIPIVSLFLISCTGFHRDNNITKSLITDVGQPIYLENIRLVSPAMYIERGNIVYGTEKLQLSINSDKRDKGVWILARDPDFRKIIFSYREKVADQYVWGKIAGSVATTIISLPEIKQRFKDRNYPDQYVLDEKYSEIQQKVDKENSKRRQILSKTVEEHWNHKRSTQTIEEMGEGVRIHYEGGPKDLNRVLTTDEERLKWHRESFFYHEGRERARYIGLLDDTVEIVQLDGVDCIQSDQYERLTTPIINPSKSADGIAHIRFYHCYFGPDLKVLIRSQFDIAPGYDLDFDAMLHSMLSGLRWPADLKIIYDIHSQESKKSKDQ